ncbi:protein-glutamate O-methyltransferase CheR [Sphingobacterium olei]|uniref:Protein-glutamate O-methyltransferase CheR n=1 Tax=Sphingobacterium olei TaxID=2571155 RepID=A0A4U0P1X7_9SPHI|nr:protein-glutamate O-methyltransferase CheR [Sphingobacterium olei]TJZ61205.1 protein-glutamate O-methyltransferase CheR [Sphingobacterium olei]
MAKLKEPVHITFEELDEVVYLLKKVADYDLSGYSKSSLKRRVQRLMGIESMDLVDLKNAILNVEGFFGYFIQEITVNVTEMFRDPLFYQELKNVVFPYLQTYPQLRVWSAGCATGEEAYSLSILLHEENLLDRSFIYGTDISQQAINIAKKGVYTMAKIKSYTENYNRVGLNSKFSDHYTAMYDAAIINNEYRNSVLFSNHNLVSDNVFNEFQLICCRNVLIYFDKELQRRVLNVFYESLSLFGFLCLGTKESLYGQEINANFKVINKSLNIYQKIK